MTGRENCTMCQIHGGKIYCDYYDAFYMLCEEVDVCPDGLDGDDDDDEYEYYNEDDDFSKEIF